jgi:choice-of-anchor C domain-containing protein
MKVLGFLVGAAMLLGAQSAHAITVVNGGFESPIVGGNFQTLGAGSNGLDGWTIGGSGVDHIGSYWQPAEGNQSLDMNATGPGSISQELHGFTIGQEYAVTFSLAANPEVGPTVKNLEVTIGNYDGFFGALTTGHSFSNMGWLATTFTFIANANDLTLSFLSGTSGAAGPALDNISVVATTPIPGAILLFGSALGGMGFLGYRRRKLTGDAAA